MIKKYVYEFTNKRKLTKAEFLKWFQKKSLYTIRKFEMIKKGEIILYKNNRGYRDVVLEDILKMFSEKGHVKLLKSKSSKFDKFAVSCTADSESEKFISELIKGKVKNIDNLAPISGKIIKPLYLFLDKEVLLYAKLKNLRFKENSLKKNRISVLLNNLELRHPEIKLAIIKSYLKIKNI